MCFHFNTIIKEEKTEFGKRGNEKKSENYKNTKILYI